MVELTSIVGFFSLILATLISVFWVEDLIQQVLMVLTFGIGFLLLFLEFIASSGTIVAIKYSLMAVAFVALGIACYFDYLDSDGIVG